MHTALTRLGFTSRHNDLDRLEELVAFSPPALLRFNFSGFYDTLDAVNDLPIALCYRQLLAAYPRAKFVLSTRDPDRWWASMVRWHPTFKRAMWGDTLPRRNANTYKLAYGSEEPVAGDKAVARTWKAHFAAHAKDVIAAIPPEQLLVLDVTAGNATFGALCGFLGLDRAGECPPHKHRLPHRNKHVVLSFPLYCRCVRSPS